MSDAPTAEPELAPAARVAAYALVLVLTLLLTVWGSFLVPFRIGGTVVPVALVVAAVGNVAVGRAGGLLLGRSGALVPGLLWLAVAVTLGSKRAEGDLVVPGTTMGLAYLVVGAVASSIAYGMTSRR